MVEVISFRCDTCGGGLEHVSGNSYLCPYCGGKKFVNTCTDAEKGLIQLGDGARRAMRFDEAIENYEAVLKTAPQNFNALWGLFLSEYGIEYVKDVDDSYKPTFHRLSRISVFANRNMQTALDLLKGEEKIKYESDAAAIERIRVKTLQAADRIEPYDIFICYKKTKPDGNGLTPEAAWAQDYYTELRAQGYKVFWADKSIKPGDEYEPSVYNALFTAKFMIILCSDPEHLNATWVINEWGRFLRRRKDEPSIEFCVVYENVEPYTLPRALQKSQAIDHSRAASFGLLKEAIEKTVHGGVSAAAPQPAQRLQKIQKPEKPYNKKHFKIRLGILFSIPLLMLITGFAFWRRFPVSTAAIVIYSVLIAVFIGIAIYDRRRLAVSRLGKKIFAAVMAASFAIGFLFSVGVVAWVNTYDYYDGYGAEFYYVNYYTIPDENGNDVYMRDGITLRSYEGNATEIVIPEQINGKPVRAIGSYFFTSTSHGYNVTAVTIPANMVVIPQSTFHSLQNLTSVTISDSSQLLAVGEGAFEYCKSLTSFAIPAGVKSIGKNAFRGCENLTSVTIANNSQLTTIGDNAFDNCKSLKSITIPAGIKSIGKNMFYDCEKLESVTIENSSQLTTIGDSAFYNCKSLTDFTIPAGVTTIGQNAFNSCTGIPSILIPSSVTAVGSSAFAYWKSTQTIRVQGSASHPSGWDILWDYRSNAQISWNA